MGRKLTKQNILDGSSKRETLFIKDYEGEVVIRPLTDGELTKVFAVLGNIQLREDGTPNVNRVEIAKNLEALRIATSLGLVEPALTLEEVGRMRFGIPEYIGTRVLELSGVAEPAEVKKKG
jgi:hypothetical protein